MIECQVIQGCEVTVRHDDNVAILRLLILGDAQRSEGYGNWSVFTCVCVRPSLIWHCML